MNKEGYQSIKSKKTIKIIPPNTSSNVQKKRDGYTWEDLDEVWWEGFDNAKSKMEKRIAELEATNKKISDECHKLVDSLDTLQKKNVDLEKENAELKEFINAPHTKERKTTRGDYIKTVWELSEKLTKAKEIIKRFSEFVNNEVEYDPEHPQEHTDLWNELCKEVEQFLKENE